MQDFGYFLGRFHVLVLHLPIGIILAAVALQWLARRPRYRHLATAAPVLWGAAALTAIVTVALGYLHFAEGGFSGPSASAHRLYGTSVAVVATAVWLVSRQPAATYRLVELGGGVLLLLLVTLTGHYGGNLTHGSTYLVEYAPAPLRTLVGAAERRLPVPNPDAAVGAPVAVSPDSEVLAALSDAGFLARPVSQTDSHLVVSAFSPGATLTADQLAALAPAAGDIVELDLHGAGIDDATLPSFDAFTELTKLKLSDNRLTDAALASLERLPKLESLNLYANPGVTDAGLRVLARIASLKRVYLWETGVSAAGLAGARAASPGSRRANGLTERR